MKRLFGCIAAALILMTVSVKSWADDADDKSVQTETQRIDKMSGTDDQKTGALAKQFQVPDSTVQDLRAKGQGWGEITIGLSTAQQLAKSDPKTYPTLADALTKVESLRSSGEGWGKIAKDLGFKLGPVISQAQHARHEMAGGVHSDTRDHGDAHSAHMNHPEHPDHPSHPDHPDHPDHMEHLDRPGH